MAEAGCVEFRAGRTSVLAAWLMVAVAGALLVGSVASAGLRGVSALIIAGPISLLAAAVIRTRVVAAADGLSISVGIRQRTLPWSHIDGFRIEDTRGQRRVHVLVEGDRTIALPIANGVVLLTRRRELTDICEALDAEWRRYSSHP